LLVAGFDWIRSLGLVVAATIYFYHLFHDSHAGLGVLAAKGQACQGQSLTPHQHITGLRSHTHTNLLRYDGDQRRRRTEEVLRSGKHINNDRWLHLVRHILGKKSCSHAHATAHTPRCWEGGGRQRMIYRSWLLQYCITRTHRVIHGRN
jgi:hypothetical protein